MTDMRAIRTRQYLRDALTGLLLGKPLEEITVREVVGRAQVSKNSFYNHYSDLDALVADCYLEEIPYFSHSFTRLGDYEARRDACTEVLNVQAHVMSFFKGNPNLARAILDSITTSPYYGECLQAEKDILIDHMETEFGPYACEYTAYENSALFVACGKFGLLRAWFLDGMRKPIEAAAKEIIHHALSCMAGINGHTLNPEYVRVIEEWHYIEDAR